MIVIGRDCDERPCGKLWKCPRMVNIAINIIITIVTIITIIIMIITIITIIIMIITIITITIVVIIIINIFLGMLWKCPRTVNIAGNNGLNLQPQIHNTFAKEGKVQN